LPTLGYRRVRGDMIEMYKIIKGKYDKDVITLVKTAEESEVRHSTKTNTKKIVQQRANTELTRNFFSIRVAKVWNRLPEKIVMAPSINSFKNRLDKYWKDQKLYYEDYRAIIVTKWRNFYTLM
jgi:hypothetical protein